MLVGLSHTNMVGLEATSRRLPGASGHPACIHCGINYTRLDLPYVLIVIVLPSSIIGGSGGFFRSWFSRWFSR